MDYVIFCGNPGYGKSTLCNCIFQRPVFQSGLSDVEGLTKTYQQETVNKTTYIDTPGLADEKLRQKAGIEITNAFRKNGRYKLIFVIIPESGRIRKDDLATILVICDAIKVDFSYGLIVNKLSPNARQRMLENMNIYVEVLPKKPAKIMLINRMSDADDIGNYIMASSFKDELIRFIDTLDSHYIRPIDINQINTASFTQRLNQVKKMFYQSRLTEERQNLISANRVLELAIRDRTNLYTCKQQKHDYKNAAQNSIETNNRLISSLKTNIKDNQVNSVAGASALTGGGVAFAVPTFGLALLASSLASAAIGAVTKSANDSKRREISQLSMRNINNEENIYNLVSDIARTDGQIKSNSMSIEEQEKNISRIQETINTCEEELRDITT